MNGSNQLELLIGAARRRSGAGARAECAAMMIWLPARCRWRKELGRQPAIATDRRGDPARPPARRGHTTTRRAPTVAGTAVGRGFTDTVATVTRNTCHVRVAGGAAWQRSAPLGSVSCPHPCAPCLLRGHRTRHGLSARPACAAAHRQSIVTRVPSRGAWLTFSVRARETLKLSKIARHLLDLFLAYTTGRAAGGVAALEVSILLRGLV